MSNARLVADHYNARADAGLAARKTSRILALRNYNNWVKSVLINEYAPGRDSAPVMVLDFCGGKGGDLNKWTIAGVDFVCLADIAQVSVTDALHRYNTMRRRSFSAMFIAADCFSVDLSAALPTELAFSLVSCQFAFHYSFETEARCRQALRNVAQRLLPGHGFIATISDGLTIMKRLRAASGNSFGNDVYKVEFPEDFDKAKAPAAFGTQYLFTLTDAVTQCAEYLVHPDVLIKLAAEYGLELVARERFDTFYQTHHRKHESLYHRMVGSRDAEMTPDLWEAVTLYSAYAFRKSTPSHGGDAMLVNRFQPPPIPTHPLPDSRVVVLESPNAHGGDTINTAAEQSGGVKRPRDEHADDPDAATCKKQRE